MPTPYLPPLHCAELHLLANTSQTIVGLQRLEDAQEAFDRFQGVAATIDSADLAPLPRKLCRQIIIDTLLQLSELRLRRDPEWPRRVRSVLVAESTLAGAVRQLLSQLPASAARRTHPLTTRLITAIQLRHTERGLQEADIARALNVSTNTVGRILRHEMGTNFRALVREARLRHASELLREGGLSLKQISWTVGYKHSSQLSRDFARARQ